MEERYGYVIVGGGIAGVSCVEQILEFDPKARILLISASSVVKEASDVTRLTKTLQDFVLVEKSFKSFKDVHQTVQVIQDEVVNLFPEQRMIVTKSMKKFVYQKLCICSGGIPRVLFPESKYVIGVRDTQSVQDLAQRIKTAKRVILLGNGGIATELVHEVEGVEIIWVIKDKSISANYVDAGAAEFFLQAKLSQKEKGVSCGSGQDYSVPCKKHKCDENDESNGVKAQVKASSESSAPVPEITKRLKYSLLSLPSTSTHDESSGENTTLKIGGSALGPDWHEGIKLKGLNTLTNVRIIRETECTRVIETKGIGSAETGTEGDKEEWPVSVELTNDTVIGGDLIISATGVTPNCSWACACQQDPEKGIFVDTAMRTSVPNVYAAGDVCFPNWKWAKHWFQMRLWTQARQMGLYAGKSMFMSISSEAEDSKLKNVPPTLADKEKVELDFCFEIFSHVTKFFGFKVVLLGLYNGQGLDPVKQQLILRCTPNSEYVKVVLEDWRMQGAVLIGETGLEETFENLILNQVDLSSYGEDLLNPDIDIEDYFD